MTEETSPSHPLADRALARLRKLATGNGLEPAAVSVMETQEQEFALPGQLELSPMCEMETLSYPGGVRGKGRKLSATFAEMQAAIAKHQQDFRENPDWVAEAVKEVKTHENQGWGLTDAKITLPQKSAIFAATETCPTCSGRQMLTCTQCNAQGTVVCTQCQGQGRELCYYCGGRGEDPQQPGQRCHTCNGTRYAPCRFCQTHGYLPCPTCNGKRGTPCTTCKASGQVSQETTVTCGADAHFKLLSSGLPSGLRRGLDRIGIANLGKGHADITAGAPGEEESVTKRDPGHILALTYKARLPYAELRMRLGNKKAVIAVVGKRCAISGVPPFLDEPLQPWRDKLRLAKAGKGSLEEAIEARALHEILSLSMSGKGRVEEVRRLYPFGLSNDFMISLLNDTQLALNRTTLKTRTIIAVACVALCTGLFYGWFIGGVEKNFTGAWMRWNQMAADISLLGATLAAGWVALNFSTRFVLKQRFPQKALALNQKIGKTGYAMLGAIAGAFVFCLMMAPAKPLWLALLLRR